MPMDRYFYHGQAVGFEADIWEPGPYKIDGHARCGLPDQAAGRYAAEQGPHEIPNVLSHGGCSSVVDATEEDQDGFFRTEVHSTIEDLKIEGDALTADRITLGLVSVYRRHWFDGGKPHSRRVRVVPYGCQIVNLQIKGVPQPDLLPAPFHYSKDRAEAYLRADDPDPAVETEIRQAILESPTRSRYIKNFGRIYLGEWTLLPNEDWHLIHRISMLRLAMGSPQSGNGSGGTGQTNGHPG